MTYFTADYIVTQQQTLLADHYLLVEDGVIKEIAPLRQLQPRAFRDMVAFEDALIVPGLINAYTQSQQVLLKGMASAGQQLHGLPYPEAKLAALLAYCQLIRQGVTTVCDRLPQGALDDVATLTGSLQALKDAAEQTGIRLTLLYPVTHPQQVNPDTWQQCTQPLTSATVQVIPIVTQWRREAPATDTLRAVVQLVETLDLPAYYLHLAPTAPWREDVVNRLGESPVAWLHQQGLLHPKGVSLFGTWLTDEDMALLAAHQPRWVATPSSSMGNGQPCPRVQHGLTTGLSVAMGTGHWAGSSRGMLLDELRLTALAQQAAYGQALPMPAQTLLGTVTHAPGQVLGQAIGQLKPQHKADFMVLDLEDWSLQPHNQLLHHLVFALSSSAISAVYVEGKRVMDMGDLLNVNESNIMRQARQLAERLKAMDHDAIAGWV